MSSKAATRGNSVSTSSSYRWATVDRVIIAAYVMFALIAIFVDYINAFAPAGPIKESYAKTWSWPPKFIWDLYFWWAKSCDPVLQQNPVWIKYLSLLSPCLFLPYYAVAIPAIAWRRSFIRIPSVMFATALLLVLSTFFVEAAYGQHPSPNMLMFAAGYGPYQLFPLLVLWRFWRDDPFDKRKGSKAA